MPHATVNGLSLYYEVHGQGEPLVLVSGQGSDHHTWDFVRDDFAARYQVIVFDHRGTGHSDKPESPPYSTRGFAADVVGLLDALGIERAHAYGISMGGRICQWLGIDHGDRMGALVLGCTTPGNAHGVPRPPEVDAKMANRPSEPAEVVQFLVEQMVSPEWAEQHPEYVEAVWQRVRNPIPEFARKLHYQASEGHDTWDSLSAIANPVLVIHGDNDQVNPSANAPLLADRIPGAELHIVPGGRHGYFNEFRGEASRVVLDFLQRHPLEVPVT
ncbi:MAG: alpha/beta fold hydrolase [Dehalococcoidia bacterium]|nr:alpha/beta fold hydrolase [Dehalococcoidia bacterium]